MEREVRWCFGPVVRGGACFIKVSCVCASHNLHALVWARVEPPGRQAWMVRLCLGGNRARIVCVVCVSLLASQNGLPGALVLVETSKTVVDCSTGSSVCIVSA